MATVAEQRMREWFNALDADGNGQIDPAEFFAFALREALVRADQHVQSAGLSHTVSESHMGFKALFQSSLPTADGSGNKDIMNRDQFCKLAENLGFSAVAESIFDHLVAKSGKQELSIQEMLET